MLIGRRSVFYGCALLTSALFLAACDAEEGSVTPEPSGTKTLSGAAADWTEQATSVRADGFVRNLDAAGTYVGIAEGTINPSGEFSLTLPGPEGVEAALYTVESENFCALFSENGDATGMVTVSPGRVSVAEVGALPVYPSSESGSDEFLGVISYEGGGSQVHQMYSSAAATIQGSCTTVAGGGDSSGGAGLETTTDIFDLNLVAGWNDVIYTTTDLGEGAISTSIATGDIPEEVSWRYFDFSTSAVSPTH